MIYLHPFIIAIQEDEDDEDDDLEILEDGVEEIAEAEEELCNLEIEESDFAEEDIDVISESSSEDDDDDDEDLVLDDEETDCGSESQIQGKYIFTYLRV